VMVEAADGVQAISSVTGAGVGALREKIAGMLGAPGAKPVESVALATERHRVHADRAREALERSAQLLRQSTELELVAVEIRAAVQSLKEILGAIGPEELLGRIFSRFCIGK